MNRQQLKEEVEKILFGDEQTKKECQETMPEIYNAFLKNIDSILSLFNRALEEVVGKIETEENFTELKKKGLEPSDYGLGRHDGRNSLRQEIIEKWRDKE